MALSHSQPGVLKYGQFAVCFSPLNSLRLLLWTLQKTFGYIKVVLLFFFSWKPFSRFSVRKQALKVTSRQRMAVWNFLCTCCFIPLSVEMQLAGCMLWVWDGGREAVLGVGGLNSGPRPPCLSVGTHSVKSGSWLLLQHGDGNQCHSAAFDPLARLQRCASSADSTAHLRPQRGPLTRALSAASPLKSDQPLHFDKFSFYI